MTGSPDMALARHRAGARRYLLITHVPFRRGATAGTYRLGDMWLEDLRAQRRALGGVCTRLVDLFNRDLENPS